MSYLPYSADTVSGWVLATGTSLLAHGAVILLGYSGFVQLAALPPEPDARPEYTITLERLDSDTLAGLLERQSPTAEAEADPDAPAAESETLALPEPEPEPDSEPEPETAALPEPEPEQAPAAEVAPEPVTPEPLEPEPVTPAQDIAEAATPEPVTAEPVTAETVTPEPVIPEPVIAETVTPDSVTADTVTPESATALDPVLADDPAPVDTATPEPLPTETVTAAPVDTPDPVASNPLVAETLAPVSPIAADQTGFSAIPSQPVAQQPRAPQSTTALPVAPAPAQQTQRNTTAEPVQRIITTAPPPTTGTSDSPAPSAAPETVSALNTATTAALPVIGRQTPRRAALPATPPTAQDLAVGDLIARIRATPADPCLLALPRRDGDDGVGLELIAANDTAMAQFATALLTPADSAIRQTRTLVDPRQCAALAYLRDNRDYPATRLGIALDTPEVASGGEVSGVLRGIAGRYVLLLLVDNNGVVQDLQRFMSFSGNFARFIVPVTRVGPQRDTSQSLIAITTDTPAATIRARDGQLAADVFRDLDPSHGRNAAIGFATFDVR